MAKINFSNIKGAESAQKAFDSTSTYDKSVFQYPEKTRIQMLESGEDPSFHQYATEDNPYYKVRVTEHGKDPVETYMSGRAFWNLQVQIDQKEDVPTWSTDRADKITNLKTYVKNHLDVEEVMVEKMVVEIVGWYMTDVKAQLVEDTDEENVPQLNVTYYEGSAAFRKARTKWQNEDPTTRQQGFMTELYETLVNSGLNKKGKKAMKMDFTKEDFVMDAENRKHFTTTPVVKVTPNQE